MPLKMLLRWDFWPSLTSAVKKWGNGCDLTSPSNRSLGSGTLGSSIVASYSLLVVICDRAGVGNSAMHRGMLAW